MYGLVLESERCPDGVQLVDRGPERPAGKALILRETVVYGTVGGKWFTYRTKRRVPVRIEIPNLEHTVVVAFVNARTDEERVAFLSRFGLTVPKAEIKRSDVLTSQRQLRGLLAIAGGEDKAAAIEAVTGAVGSHGSFNLQPALDLAGERGAPRMMLQIPTLLGLMLMETAMAASNDAKFAACAHCEAVFLTGPLTWRRAHAKFCSDKCRVAAMRARKAG
jgi:hypothetical protein